MDAAALKRALPQAELDAPTAALSNLGIGGTAAVLVQVRSLPDLISVLAAVREAGVHWMVLGGGTNSVFPPRVEGVVIQLLCERLSIHGTEVSCEANVRWMPLLRTALQRGLGGLEAFAGLPGTVGGAVRGNAGCFGYEIKDALVQATIVGSDGTIETRPAEWFEFNYRTSRLKREPAIVWDATFRFTPLPIAQIQERMRTIASARAEKQPAGKSTGSFFLNPPDDAAGRLIDAAGLKGLRKGGVFVSDKHGNFLMNSGGGTPEELAALVVEIQARVETSMHVLLVPEVLLVERPWWEAQGVRFGIA